MTDTTLFNIKLKPEEKEQLIQMSNDSGLSYSQIIRMRVFGAPDPYQERFERLEKLIQETLNEVRSFPRV